MSQPSPLSAARQRAQALLGSADFAGARDVLEHAVEVGKGALGEDDPDVLATLHQLAQLHLRADDPAAARRLLEEAYAAGQWRLGDTAPLMLEISFDLGLVAEELGNRHEARKAFTRVAGIGPDVLGADHWAVVQARAYLGDDPSVAAPAPAYSQDLNPQDPTRYAAEQPPPPPHTTPLEHTRPPEHTTPTGYSGPIQHTAPTQHAATTQYTTPIEQSPAIHDTAPPEAAIQLPVRPEPAAPPPPILHIVPTQPGATTSPPYRRRGVALYAAIAASLAAIIAVIALVFVLADGGKGTGNVPTLSGAPPTDVRLTDNGSSIDVTWSDPASGKSTFMITMAHPGELLKPVTQVGPGQTSYRLTGLSTKLDYCFVVVAVYGTDKFAKSALTCTSRPGTR